MESHLQCTEIEVALATGEKILVVRINITCPMCGPQQFVVAGHHLRALRDALVQVIDRHPTLTGADAGVKAIESLQFSVKGPADPSAN